MKTELSHQELSLLLFALDGGKKIESSHSPSCEEACPVTEHFEELFSGAPVPPEKRLIQHLNNHLRECLGECGILEVMQAVGANGTERRLSPEDHASIERMNQQLKSWTCQIGFDSTERQILREALSRLPVSAWTSMPRTLWRLKRKLKRANP